MHDNEIMELFPLLGTTSSRVSLWERVVDIE